MDGGLTIEQRSRIHAALGDPARLAIVDALVLNDASPGDIGRDLCIPTNLVAHHVNVLKEAGLVTRLRSEGDRRRTYLHLDTRLLATVLKVPAVTGGRVVFVCTQNSARSPLAAALWRKRTGQHVASAGTRPAGRVHRRALRIAQEHGLVIEPTETSHLSDVVRDGDVIVAVCDSAHEELAGDIRPALHWSVPDPVGADTDAAFKATYDDLADRVELLAAALPHDGR